jgi:hypothetical protein
MPSLRNSILAIAATLIATASSDYVIDPDSVSKSTREYWCSNEKVTCPLICQQTSDGTTKVNECDPDTLTYGCICGDGKQPNVSEYSLTLPYYVCQEWGNQCVEKCDGSNSCASDCRQKHPCGAQSPQKANKTKSTGTASATGASATASGTDSADTIYTDVASTNSADSDNSDSSSDDKGGAAMALEAGSRWGLVVVLGSMFAGFALL